MPTRHKKYLLLMLSEYSNWVIESEFDTLPEFVERLNQGNIYGEIMLVENLTWYAAIEGKEDKP